MKNYICVYDFETDGKIPQTCEPTQLAACMINPRTLEIVEKSEFVIDIRPPKIDEDSYIESCSDTINFHVTVANKNSKDKNSVVTRENVIDRWKGGIDQKVAWNQFLEYLEKYNKNQSRKSMFDAPIRAGANIRGFDNIIIDRLCVKYGNINKDGRQNIFHPRDVIDTLDLCFYWFENLKEPTNYSLDVLRPFFGLSEDGHEALKDVRDTSWIIQKMLKLHRSLANRISFKGSASAK